MALSLLWVPVGTRGYAAFVARASVALAYGIKQVQEIIELMHIIYKNDNHTIVFL
jgi:hypothetical protein